MAEGSSTRTGSLGLTLSLGWLASVNIVVTLVIHWYVITRLGIGVESDALFAGMVVPQMVLVLFTSSLLHVLVPLLATRADEGAGDLRRELWGIFLLVAGAAAVVAAVLYLGAGYWMRWLVPGFSAEGYALAVALTRIQLFGLLFAALDCVLRAACRARRSFVWAEAATPIANVAGLLLLIWALPRYGVRAAAWITVLRIALPVALMWPVLGRWRRPRLWSPVRREALRRVRPLLLGGLYNQITPLVTRQLASLAPAGGLSLLSVSQQFYGTANTVLDKALVIPASPTLAVQARNGQWRNFRALYRRRLVLLALLAGAAYVCVLAFGRPLLAFLVGHGGVTAENVNSLWWMLSSLGVAFMSNVMGQPVFAAFCAKGDTRTPVRLAFIINTVNIPARALTFWAYGLMGMALMMSASAAVGLLVNLFFLEKSISVADGRASARKGGTGQEDEALLASRAAADAT
ncbi:MAG TPA: lipid II flippase MurJ [Pyrinomonadaceae bacterium]|nr:lipid II flippase MurJ [Pyrinomonadaceae bacterium]